MEPREEYIKRASVWLRHQETCANEVLDLAQQFERVAAPLEAEIERLRKDVDTTLKQHYHLCCEIERLEHALKEAEKSLFCGHHVTALDVVRKALRHTLCAIPSESQIPRSPQVRNEGG